MDSYSEEGRTLAHFIVEHHEAKYHSDRTFPPSFFRALSERDRDGNTPIHIIMLKERLAYLELFYDQVDLTPILSIRNKKGETPLHIAAAKGEPYLDFFKLEEATAALALRNNKGELALDVALKKQSISAAYTLAYYMPAEDIYRCFWQANRATKTVQDVVSIGNQEIVKTLLTIYYSKCDDEKHSILSCFTKCSLSQYETIAEFYSDNYWNCTIFTIYELFDRDSVRREVFEKYTDDKGQTLFHKFAISPDVRLFNNAIFYTGSGRHQFVLAKRDSMGRTPLHMMLPNVSLLKHLHCVMKKDLNVLKAVLKVQCDSGYTPLQTLCMRGKEYGDEVLKCIKFIAELDEELLSPPGERLVDLARKHSGHKELVAYLSEKTEPESEIESEDLYSVDEVLKCLKFFELVEEERLSRLAETAALIRKHYGHKELVAHLSEKTEPESAIRENSSISFTTALRQACEAIDLDHVGKLTSQRLMYPGMFGELLDGGTCTFLICRAINHKAWRCFEFIALNTQRSLYAVKCEGKTPMHMINDMDDCEAKTMMLTFCKIKGLQ